MTTQHAPEDAPAFAITSVILGALAQLSFCILPLSLVLGIIGLVLGCIGAKGHWRGLSYLGIILSVLPILVAVGMAAMFGAAFHHTP